MKGNVSFEPNDGANGDVVVPMIVKRNCKWSGTFFVKFFRSADSGDFVAFGVIHDDGEAGLATEERIALIQKAKEHLKKLGIPVV
jgi:hypothetical protein